MVAATSRIRTWSLEGGWRSRGPGSHRAWRTHQRRTSFFARSNDKSYCSCKLRCLHAPSTANQLGWVIGWLIWKTRKVIGISINHGESRGPTSRRDLDGWADEIGASRRTLTRLFRDQTGFSLGAWRRRLRLLTAAARLADGEPPARVAVSVGYRSIAAFRSIARREPGEGSDRLPFYGRMQPKTRDVDRRPERRDPDS